MVTGDNESTVKIVTNEILIDQYCSNLLPEDKVEILKKSKEKYRTVAMVGDGVNDSPSLASRYRCCYEYVWFMNWC